MPNPRLASRYAKALLDLAVEKSELEAVYADMQWLHAVCKSNPDFVNLLRSPIVKADTKRKILEAITKGNISVITNAFINLMVTKGREFYLPEVIIAFLNQYKELKNIHTVQLTTATPISETVKNEIIAKVKSNSGFENIELVDTVNEDIIGGFVIQVGDKLLDASIAYDLKSIAKQFDKNDFIHNIR